MPVHPTATHFDGVGDRYERGRPGYAHAAVDHIVAAFGLQPGATVVDVGAGTGKMTRLLMDAAIQVVAVEPLAGMRVEFERALTSVDLREGTADRLPIDDGEADAIVCASAFHWFATTEVSGEFARVLRPGGGLALVWNVRDTTLPWTAAVNRLIEKHDDDEGRPRYASGRWRD